MGGGMKRIVAALVMIAAQGLAAPASAQTVGVVLMHGQRGSPAQVIDGLAVRLLGAGYSVETPEMCWSGRRLFDRPLLDCLAEIDGAVARLTGRGARKVVVAGMSLGGMAALAYGARYPNAAGIIALAAAGAPERLVNRLEIAGGVAQARALVAAGRGNETAAFPFLNSGGPFSANTTAATYLSFFAPEGPANMLDNTGKLRAPLLWVAGTADPSQRGTDQVFARAPANRLNRHVSVNSDHLGTPLAARDAVLAWLQELK
jgi:pimeloyl-ACP methyl ester carboxylesterase